MQPRQNPNMLQEKYTNHKYNTRKKIDQVKLFKYLFITDDGTSSKKIRSRIGQTKNIFLLLYFLKEYITDNNKHEHKHQKEANKNYAWRVELYGCET